MSPWEIGHPGSQKNGMKKTLQLQRINLDADQVAALEIGQPGCGLMPVLIGAPAYSSFDADGNRAVRLVVAWVPGEQAEAALSAAGVLAASRREKRQARKSQPKGTTKK